MDKVALYKDDIYETAIEKKAISLAPILEGLKSVGKTVAESNVGQKVINSGLGTKMAIGAAGGLGAGLLKTPQQGQDRLSNAVGGTFAGATAGMTAHGLTSGLGKTLLGATASEYLNEVFIEKEAGAGTEVADGLMNGAKRLYNRTIGANTLKTTLMGAGVGAAAGAMKYNEDQDDGSFEHSRFGAMSTGALAGGGAGLATGMIFPKIKGVSKAATNKVAEFKDDIYDSAIEKKASNPIITGARNAVQNFKDLDEVTRVAIGSGIGATTGVMVGIKKQKGVDTKKLEKLKAIGKDGLDGALMGAAIGGMIGYKPGQFKEDIFGKEGKGGIKL